MTEYSLARIVSSTGQFHQRSYFFIKQYKVLIFIALITCQDQCCETKVLIWLYIHVPGNILCMGKSNVGNGINLCTIFVPSLVGVLFQSSKKQNNKLESKQVENLLEKLNM